MKKIGKIILATVLFFCILFVLYFVAFPLFLNFKHLPAIHALPVIVMLLISPFCGWAFVEEDEAQEIARLERLAAANVEVES